MRRAVVLFVVLLGGTVARGQAAAAADVLAAVHSGRCARCHAGAPALGEPFAAPPPIPLTRAGAYFGGAALAHFLVGHHGGADAAALAAFVRAAGPTPPFVDAAVAPLAIADGERHWQELACGACHDRDGIAGLPLRTDHAALRAFLLDPAARRPDLQHAFALAPTVADAIAAWLLREQRRTDAARPGLEVTCYELRVEDDQPPQLDGRSPATTGIAATVDVAPRSRDDHFALRFAGQLLVPTTGEWTLTVGCDDCAWLWLDGELVVANAALAPHRQQHHRLQLAAGAHALRLDYTEAEGQQSLELLWEGPGQPRAPVPASALATRPVVLTAPGFAAAAATDALLARGAAAFAARRCARCHAADAADAADAPGKPWSELGERPCPVAADGPALAASARAFAGAPVAPAVALEAALSAHGCRACHARAGRGGLAPAARRDLVEVEDLGDEGRIPPDLTAIGQRLRPAWLEAVLRGDRRARPYVRAAMPHLPGPLASAFARAFAAADGGAAGDREPPFDAALVDRGRTLAGVRGKGCVTCHVFAGRRALGPQGMDLALQAERLQPGWFAAWLLQPTALRPGTRMPALWPAGDAADRAEIAAVYAWARLGELAPVPDGARAGGDGLPLDPVARPILHGAFLDELSARCVAVGSPLRAHCAYDVAHAELRWLWRGAFLDAAGTWNGRAGKLLRPAGTDLVVLEPLPIQDLAGGDGADDRAVVGQLRDGAGYAGFVLRVGTAELEDWPVPRLVAGGAEFVRTLRVRRGAIRVGCTAGSGRARLSIDGEPAAERTLRAGDAVALVYRW